MDKKVITGNFKKAFKCNKCPQQAGENGCPLWWEILYTNVQTGQEELRCGCGFALMPLMFIENLKSANQAAESAQRFRNDLITSFTKVMSKVALEGLAKKEIRKSLIGKEVVDEKEN